MKDVIIVGGGPAGLQAALILGRCCRNVLLFNGDLPRNHVAKKMSGVVGNDGVPPLEFLSHARDQLQAYPNVTVIDSKVESVRPLDSGGFEARLENGTTYRARKALLATGLGDQLPDVPGVADLLGQTVFTCPYCDGWEHRDKPVHVYSGKENGPGFALEMKVWSQDVTLLTDGHELDEGTAERMRIHQVKVRTEKIARLDADRVVFENGQDLPVAALFLATHQNRRCGEIAESLGCRFEDGVKTNIPGLFAAGDTTSGVQMVVVAAAEGAQAAVAINEEIHEEDLKKIEEEARRMATTRRA